PPPGESEQDNWQHHRRSLAQQRQDEQRQGEKIEGGGRKMDAGCWILDAGCWMLDVGICLFVLAPENLRGRPLSSAFFFLLSAFFLLLSSLHPLPFPRLIKP